MGLSSALYSGTSGLNAHGEKMSVIGNNLSNVNTIGYKKSRMHFEDALSQTISTASGPGQVGRGVSVAAVMDDFSQGSMQSTNQATDVAIGGDGFFIVSPKGEENQFYTRAGNFRFDKDGYLVDPHNYVVQGWEVQQEQNAVASASGATEEQTGVQTEGDKTDIRLENFQSAPQASSKVDMIANLDSSSEDHATSDEDPFFAMWNQWDATEDDPIGDTQYAYQTTIKVYDQNGNPHNLTTYFDPVRDDLGDTEGKQHWEYMVTVPPEADNRTFWADDDTKRGVLMSGSLTFSSGGILEDMSAYTLRDADNDPDDGADGPEFNQDGDPDNLYNWMPAQFSQEGYPMCTANFLGAADADTTNQNNAQNIAMNFGLRNRNTGDPDANLLAGWTNLDNNGEGDEGHDAANVADIDGAEESMDYLPEFNDSSRQANATTSFSSGSTTIFQAQNGYPPGFLQNISIDRDGVMTGSYSNGQVQNLFVLSLADFNSTQGLRREGGNLFSETRSSGPPLTNKPGTGGLGTIQANSLEQSNVDISEEFVKMIITQKGFQANSRTITTTDQMLQEVVNLKR